MFKNKTFFLVVGVALVAFLGGMFVSTLFGESVGYLGDTFGSALFSRTDSYLGGGAGAMSKLAECNRDILLGEDPVGIVLADPLNLRAGPGLNYRIITTLGICKPVNIVGRSEYGDWLEVELEGNLGGWVFSGYIQSNVKVSDLPLTQAAGGPIIPSEGTGVLDISVVIQFNQVAAFATGMPANTMINAVLAPSSGSPKGLAVASGLSDPNGNITLTFPMPYTWADGTSIKSGQMTLTLSGGGETLNAWITYYK